MDKKNKNKKKAWAATETTKRGGDAAVDRGGVLFSGAIRTGYAIPLHGTTGSLSGLGGTHGARWTGSRHKDLTLSPPPPKWRQNKIHAPSSCLFFCVCECANSSQGRGGAARTHTQCRSVHVEQRSLGSHHDWTGVPRTCFLVGDEEAVLARRVFCGGRKGRGVGLFCCHHFFSSFFFPAERTLPPSSDGRTPRALFFDFRAPLELRAPLFDAPEAVVPLGGGWFYRTSRSSVSARSRLTDSAVGGRECWEL